MHHEKNADELRKAREQVEAKLDVLDAEVTRLTEQHASDLVELGQQEILRGQLQRRYDTLETGVTALVDMIAPEEVPRPMEERLATTLTRAEDIF